MRLYRINGDTSDLDSYVSNWLTSGNSASVQGITSFIDLKEESQPVKQVYYYTSAGESLVVNDTTIIQSASDPSGRWVSIGNDDSGLIRVSSIDDANLDPVTRATVTPTQLSNTLTQNLRECKSKFQFPTYQEDILMVNTDDRTAPTRSVIKSSKYTGCFGNFMRNNYRFKNLYN